MLRTVVGSGKKQGRRGAAAALYNSDEEIGNGAMRGMLGGEKKKNEKKKKQDGNRTKTGEKERTKGRTGVLAGPWQRAKILEFLTWGF